VARSNHPEHESGAEVYRLAALAVAATPARVAATGGLLAMLGQPPEVPGFDVRIAGQRVDGHLAADAEVTERSTGAVSRIRIEAEQAPGGAATCRVDGHRFDLEALFGTQREVLLAALAA